MSNDPKSITYASSHNIVRLSAKRYEQSPYRHRYATPETIFGLYANRFYPLSLGGDPIADYWQLRKAVMLYDVPEKPIQIQGPDASALVEKIFSRKVGRLKVMRARYAIACTPQGTILMDGVLIRLALDCYWYVKANGEFDTWLHAMADGLAVELSDPKSWVLQIQGPKAMDVLAAATAEAVDSFGYFHARYFDFKGQRLLTSRTGWTGEMGFEVYSTPGSHHTALWDHLMASGWSHGISAGSIESMGIRRIEAGILDNGTDMDTSMTPFEAGLGAYIDLSKDDFVGSQALKLADRRSLLFGLTSETGIPSAGMTILHEGEPVGFITAGDWSPTLDKGIGYVRFREPCSQAGSWLGQVVILRNKEGEDHPAEVVSLPFFDPEKLIPRGLVSPDLD